MLGDLNLPKIDWLPLTAQNDGMHNLLDKFVSSCFTQLVTDATRAYYTLDIILTNVKGKGSPYLIPSVGPVADPGVQAVSPQVTVSHPPGSRLPLLSARPAVTFPAAEHHHRLAGIKLYCFVIGAHRCKQLAQGCYGALPRVGFERATY